MEGYPHLAELQGTYAPLSIYRRFSILNARNLLYLQAELVNLEKKLEVYTVQDIESGEEGKKRYARNWYFLSRKIDGSPNCAQWHTMLAIREKLKEYSTYISLDRKEQEMV